MSNQTMSEETPLAPVKRASYPKGYFVTLPIEEDRDSIHILADAWRIMVGSWRGVAVSTVLFTVLAVIAAFVITPVYRCETVLSPVNEEQSGVSGLSSLLGETGLAAVAGLHVS